MIWLARSVGVDGSRDQRRQRGEVQLLRRRQRDGGRRCRATPASAGTCPSTSNVAPRISTVPPATTPYSVAMVGTEHDDVAGVLGGQQLGRSRARAGTLVALVGSRDAARPPGLGDAEADGRASMSHRIWTCGSTAATPVEAGDVIGVPPARIGEVPKDSPSVTTILSGVDARCPRSTKLLIWLASELNTTSDQMPMVMPTMVRVVRSLRRDSSRRSRMTTSFQAGSRARLEDDDRRLADRRRGEAIEVGTPAGVVAEPGPEPVALSPAAARARTARDPSGSSTVVSGCAWRFSHHAGSVSPQPFMARVTRLGPSSK